MLMGIPLPQLGSFEFNIVAEGLRREQAEKVAFVKFIGSMLQPIAGLDAEAVSMLVTEFAEEVLQFKYNYKYETIRSRTIRERVAEHNEDTRILDKVAQLTVKDDPTDAR